MKILVLADIHSNWPALAAVQESFDVCLFVGDLVDYGTDPVACIEWAKAQVDMGVRGNHDHAVAQRVPARTGDGLRSLSAVTRPLHWRVLGSSQMKFLARLPVTRHFTLDDKSFHLLHATPRDPLDEYLGNDAEAWKSRLDAVDADFLCVGHTHVPFHLDLGRIQVVNPGSVGQPRDGDPRCSYAIIENGKVEIRRVVYDIDATIKHMRDSGVSGEPLELAESILRTGGKTI